MELIEWFSVGDRWMGPVFGILWLVFLWLVFGTINPKSKNKFGRTK